MCDINDAIFMRLRWTHVSDFPPSGLFYYFTVQLVAGFSCLLVKNETRSLMTKVCNLLKRRGVVSVSAGENEPSVLVVSSHFSFILCLWYSLEGQKIKIKGRPPAEDATPTFGSLPRK